MEMKNALSLVMMMAACGGGTEQPPDASPLPDAACTPRPPTVVFLNRTGGTYMPGTGMSDSSTNTTPLVQATTTIPPPTGVDADWPAFVACVTAKFAPFNVTITDVDPGAAAHLELLVIDQPEQVGLPATATGLARAARCQGTVGLVDGRGIAIVMWQALGNAGARCQKSAQMLGFTMGLDRAFSCPDIMTWQNTCGPEGDKTFTDEFVPCGEEVARPCVCGAGIQNSYRHLDSVTRQSCP